MGLSHYAHSQPFSLDFADTMNKKGDRTRGKESRGGGRDMVALPRNSPLRRLLSRGRWRGADSHYGGLKCPLRVPPLGRIGRLAGPRG